MNSVTEVKKRDIGSIWYWTGGNKSGWFYEAEMLYTLTILNYTMTGKHVLCSSWLKRKEVIPASGDTSRPSEIL